jgi:hypothetical protein
MVTEEWKDVVRRYTELKSRPIGEQLPSFSEEIAVCVTGSPSAGMLIGPGLVPLSSEFLHRNLGITAAFFGDDATTRKMADAVRKLHAEASESDSHSSIPEWLEEKASAAPTLWRVVMDATDLRLRREYPHVLESSDWSAFKGTATVGGCVALALQLHVDVPENYRTPLEHAMRAALEQGIPGCDAAYEDCVRSVREALLEIPRAKRHEARSVMIAMWVFGTVGNDDALINDAHLVAELAQVYQNESSGYWVSM